MMGPSCRRRTRTRKSSSRRKTLFKNQPENPSDRENSPENSPVKPSNDSSTELEVSEEMCSTPKAERHRIPEIQTCPPAPKKRRMSSSSTTSCSLRRTSIAFFAPPDIELFFNFALRGIPV